ncbi:uncharacterized protein LOC119291177 [Triticum dicoccoides]|uniref:uncharacterized protein LOC119291177 n=1 Tax=Triticum dicoccoides TaxID=85692 RepID=UPI00188F16E3|nr:uncharacterized protein LOC119291177 [Triticum dicoccoides]XP_044405452.1 uncharacterized protein LOC123129256 [Triticum aestivum]
MVGVGGAGSKAWCSVASAMGFLGSGQRSGPTSTATASSSAPAMAALLHLAGYGGTVPSSGLWRRHVFAVACFGDPSSASDFCRQRSGVTGFIDLGESKRENSGDQAIMVTRGGSKTKNKARRRLSHYISPKGGLKIACTRQSPQIQASPDGTQDIFRPRQLISENAIIPLLPDFLGNHQEHRLETLLKSSRCESDQPLAVPV